MVVVVLTLKTICEAFSQALALMSSCQLVPKCSSLSQLIVCIMILCTPELRRLSLEL
jgi:hypothetical protein